MENGENVVDFIRMPIEHIEQGVTVASQDQPKKNAPPPSSPADQQVPVIGSPPIAGSLKL